MKNEKCIVYDFRQGKKEISVYYNYKDGQLDLGIEVRSPEPVYKSNILDFNKNGKYEKNGSSREELEKPFNIA